MSDYERLWMHNRGINLEEEIKQSPCIKTNEPYQGVLDDIEIACIDSPQTKVIWWYRNKKEGVRQRNV
jgi:hypothetical protein